MSHYIYDGLNIAVLLWFIYFFAQTIANFFRPGVRLLTLQRLQRSRQSFFAGIVLIIFQLIMIFARRLHGGVFKIEYFIIVLGVWSVSQYAVPPYLGEKGIFWLGQFVPWEHIRSVVWSPFDLEKVLLYYSANAKAPSNECGILLEFTEPVKRVLLQKIPSARWVLGMPDQN